MRPFFHFIIRVPAALLYCHTARLTQKSIRDEPRSSVELEQVQAQAHAPQSVCLPALAEVKNTDNRLLRVTTQEVEFQETLIAERETEIREIESGIHELNDIFRDLGTIIQEQGGLIGQSLLPCGLCDYGVVGERRSIQCRRAAE